MACPHERIGKSQGCPFCVGHGTCPCDSFGKNYPYLLKEFDYEKNIDVNPFKLAPQSHKDIWWRCLQSSCNHVWHATPNSRVGNSQGCPGCNQSLMEKETRKILRQLTITFECQQTFIGCKHKKLLPFDIYIPELKILIELDGLQHFGISYFYDTVEKLDDRKYKDNIKNLFARENKFHLLRISYSEKAEIREHIIKFIDAVRNSTSRIEMFIGEEYKTLTN